jgi:hypothetical protein
MFIKKKREIQLAKQSNAAHGILQQHFSDLETSFFQCTMRGNIVISLLQTISIVESFFLPFTLSRNLARYRKFVSSIELGSQTCTNNGAPKICFCIIYFFIYFFNLPFFFFFFLPCFWTPTSQEENFHRLCPGGLTRNPRVMRTEVAGQSCSGSEGARSSPPYWARLEPCTFPFSWTCPTI